MERIVIVNAFGRSNRGDAVLLDEGIAEVRSVYPQAQIVGVVFEGIRDATAVHPSIVWCERVGNARGPRLIARIGALAYMFSAWIGAVAPWMGSSALLPPQQRRTLEEIRDCSIVVSAPGGYIHDTNHAYLIALFHIYLGTLLGKDVVLAPQSIGPLEGRLSRWLAAQVLRRAKYLCARESYSYDFLTRDLGLPAEQVVRVGDSAFWNRDVEGDDEIVDHEYKKLGVPSRQAIFGMTVVGWSFPHSKNPRADYENYVEAMAQIAERVSKTFGLLPVIYNQVSADVTTACAVQRKAQCPVIVDATSREPRLLRAMISRSTIFLGTRFHSCIFSMMAGRPTFAIAYLPKTQSIMQDLRLASRYAPIDAIDVDVVLGKLASDFNNLAAAEGEIARAVADYRDRFVRLRDILRMARSSAVVEDPQFAVVAEPD